MRGEGKDADFDFGVGGKFAQGPVEVAVIGARGGDDANAALVLCCAHGGFVHRERFLRDRFTGEV
jgi:hypothetical protein